MPTDASLRIDEGAAFSGRAEHQIQADEAVDGAAAKTVPSPSRDGDDAEASDRRTFVISDCQDDVTRAQRRRIGASAPRAIRPAGSAAQQRPCWGPGPRARPRLGAHLEA